MDFAIEFKNEMDSIQTEMGDLLYKVAKELGLEANKSVKLESNSQNGYFFRVTLKVSLREIREKPTKPTKLKSFAFIL